MPRGNQRVKSRFYAQKLADSNSDSGTSDSEELLNLDDKEIQKYFDIHPVEIFGRQDPVRINLRKSLVQRRLRSLKHFASSTPARVAPGHFNKSFVFSPILHQKASVGRDISPPLNESKSLPRQRENGSFKVATRDLQSSKKGGRQNESSLEPESADVRKKSLTQRHNGGLKIAQQSTERYTLRSFADKKEAHESTSESESQYVFKKPYNVQREHQTAKHRRVPEKQESATRRRLQENGRFEFQDESSSESEWKSPDVHKKARNKRRNGNLKTAAHSRTSQKLENADGIDVHTRLPDRRKSLRKRDYEKGDGTSSESESTLKGTDAQRTSQDLEIKRGILPDKQNSIRKLSRALLTSGTSSESESTLKETDAQRTLQDLESKRRNLSDKQNSIRKLSRALLNLEKRGESKTTSNNGPDVQKNGTPQELDRIKSAHRSFAEKKRDRSQALSVHERRDETSSESETTLKEPVLQNNRSPRKLDRTGSTHRCFAGKKRERAHMLSDRERRGESSSESETTLKEPVVQNNRSPRKLDRTGSTHRSFADKTRERSQVLSVREGHCEPPSELEMRLKRLDEQYKGRPQKTRSAYGSPADKRERSQVLPISPDVQKERRNGNLEISEISQKLEILEADAHKSLSHIERSIRTHSPVSGERQQNNFPQKLKSAAPDAQSSPPAKRRLIRTIAEVHADCKRRDESLERPSRQRNVSKEQEPEKGRSDGSRNLQMTIEDAPSQANPEGEPILTKSMSRRNQGGSVQNDEEPEDLFLSKTSAKDLQFTTRIDAEKEANSDEVGRGNKRRKCETSLVPEKKIDGGVCDTRNDINPPLRASSMEEVYNNNFHMSSLSECYNTSVRSNADLSILNRIHHSTMNHVMTPPATESSTPGRAEPTSNRLHASCSASDFVRKANNINRVITNLKSSRKERPPSSGSKEVGDHRPSSVSGDDAEEVGHRKTRKTTKIKENIEPTRKTTGKNKTAADKRGRSKKEDATAKTATNKGGTRSKKKDAKVQKGGDVEAVDSNSEEAAGLRRSKRERKQRDLGIYGVFMYVDEKNRPIISNPDKKKANKNKSNTLKQLTEEVSAKTRGTLRGNQQVSVEPLPGCSKEITNESRRIESTLMRNGDSELDRLQEGNECTVRDGDDFFAEDESSSLRQTEREQARRRKTRHLNLRINNSLHKIEWFNDGQQTLEDMESNISDPQVTHLIQVPSVAASGFLVIGPSGSKPPQISKKYSLMFYVVKGTASVSVMDRFFIGGPNCNFFIPFGHVYTIQNLSAKNKLTLFCVRIPP